MDKLDQDKLKECKIVFDVFDKDKDTYITTNELGDVMRILGGAPTEQELDNMINQIEETNTNCISFEKFIELLVEKLNNQESEEELVAEFAKMDKEQNGRITEADLRNLMSNYENALSNSEIEDIISEAQVEFGEIDYRKLVKVLMGKI